MSFFKQNHLSWQPKRRKTYIYVAKAISVLGKELSTLDFTSKKKAQEWKKSSEQSINKVKVIIHPVEVEGKEGYIE